LKGTFDLNFDRKTLLNDHAFAFILIFIREHFVDYYDILRMSEIRR